MDDEAVGINNGESVICGVTCMMMMIPQFSSRCTVVVDTHFLPNFRFFAVFLHFLLNFRSFSNGQKARKPQSATFFIITTCKRRFFPTKKHLILGAKTRFCGNSHIFRNLLHIKRITPVFSHFVSVHSIPIKKGHAPTKMVFCFFFFWRTFPI